MTTPFLSPEGATEYETMSPLQGSFEIKLLTNNIGLTPYADLFRGLQPFLENEKDIDYRRGLLRG